MPVVKIELWEGRNKRVKGELIRDVTIAVSAALEIPVERIQVILNEVSRDNWGIQGEQASRLE